MGAHPLQHRILYNICVCVCVWPDPYLKAISHLSRPLQCEWHDGTRRRRPRPADTPRPVARMSSARAQAAGAVNSKTVGAPEHFDQYSPSSPTLGPLTLRPTRVITLRRTACGWLISSSKVLICTSTRTIMPYFRTKSSLAESPRYTTKLCNRSSAIRGLFVYPYRFPPFRDVAK